MAEAVSLSILGWGFEWSETDPVPPTANALTTGRLTLRVGESDVWLSDGLEWNWVQLLEWLTSSWRWLMAEDGLPLAYSPTTTSDLRLHAKEAGPDEYDAFWEFLETHDFAEALPGASTSASLVVWRRGLEGHFLTAEGHFTEPWFLTRAALSGIGAEIAGRLRPAIELDDRARMAWQMWEARDAVDAERLVATAGVVGSAAQVVSLALRQALPSFEELPRSEVFAAAKMTASLPPSTVREVVDRLGSIPLADRAALDAETERVWGEVDLDDSEEPYEYGYAFAQALRQLEGLRLDDPFDPERWLRRVGVTVRREALQTHLVRAIAAWGAQHGPGILLNIADSDGQRSAAATRADLAHEMCHLLVDREGALPAADVLAGHSARASEKRANAFAAELLLPRMVAALRMRDADSEDDARRVLRGLATKYQVSQELAAWQVRNSRVPLLPDVRPTLASFVSRPLNY